MAKATEKSLTNPQKDGERKLFKDWFDKDAAQALARQIAAEYSKFEQKKFVRLATHNLANLEFAGRVQQFSGALQQTLPDDVPCALAILRNSLPASLPDCEAVTDGWLQWPVGQFIADHGVPYLDESMLAMIELTKRFSSEFAVRPFIKQYPEEVFKRLLQLTSYENAHVRRWCSEGTRPRLPWGKKLRALVEDPSPIFPILDALKDDDELYVRRSVANNLNDIAKDHSYLVIAHGKKWLKTKHENRKWIVKHALRTLIKEGHTEALALVGISKPDKLKTSLTIQPENVRIGDSISLKASVASKASIAQELLIDYLVHYVRKNGSTSAKVFKWKRLEIAPDETISLNKKHSFKITTTRALYPGAHRIELQVNGQRMANAEVRLQ